MASNIVWGIISLLVVVKSIKVGRIVQREHVERRTMGSGWNSEEHQCLRNG